MVAATSAGERSGAAKFAGALSLIAGGLSVVSAVIGPFLIAALIDAFTRPSASAVIPWYIFALIALPMLAIGVVAIAGGIMALRRRRWGLALAGAISATIVLFPLGVPAIVLLVYSKSEFAH